MMDSIGPPHTQAASLSDIVTPEEIRRILQEALQPTLLEVEDESWQHAGHSGVHLSGKGSHFFIRIASPHFSNLRPVAQHRAIYSALVNLMPRIHALRIEVV